MGQVVITGIISARRRRRLQSTQATLNFYVSGLASLVVANTATTTLSSYFTAPSSGFSSDLNTATGLSTSSVQLVSSNVGLHSIDQLRYACALDRSNGVILSWVPDPSEKFVDIQIQGKGSGYISAGVVQGNVLMVDTPPHQAMVFDSGSSYTALYSIHGYKASDLGEISMISNGVDLLLMETAGDNLLVRYRQYAENSTVPLTLHKSNNIMWVHSYQPFGEVHTSQGTVKVYWQDGFCVPVEESLTFSGLVLMVVVGVLGPLVVWTPVRSTPFGRVLLQQRVAPITKLPTVVRILTLDALGALQNLKIGEVLVILAYLLALLALTIYWASMNGWGTDGWGIALGYASLSNIMMTLLPISKSNVWLYLFGIPFERAVKFHRMLARFSIFTIVIHLLLMFDDNVLSFETEAASGVTVGFGTLALLTFALMAVTALEPIRRRFFEYFKYSHYLFLLGLIFIILHIKNPALLYFAVPFLLYVLDLGWRWYQTIAMYASTQAHLECMPGDIVKVTIKHDELSKKPLIPGSYYFLCFPEVSNFQWHPFSQCATHPGEEGALIFHIKATELFSWTGKVRTLAHHALNAIGPEASRNLSNGSSPRNPGKEERGGVEGGGEIKVLPPVRVMFDGPYGNLSIDLKDYASLLLFGAGIGITPLTSVLAHIKEEKSQKRLIQLRDVRLVWVLRNMELVDVFATFFSYIEQAFMERESPDLTFTIQLYITGTTNINIPSVAVTTGEEGRVIGSFGTINDRTVAGRPNVPELVREFAERDKGTRKGVIACCPKNVLEDVQRATVLHKVDLHQEEFGW